MSEECWVGQSDVDCSTGVMGSVQVQAGTELVSRDKSLLSFIFSIPENIQGYRGVIDPAAGEASHLQCSDG